MAHDDESPSARPTSEIEATSPAVGSSSAAEHKRRRARRRFMKTGAAGSAALVVTLQHPSAHAAGDSKKKMITSVLCLIDGEKRKVIPSVCMSVGMLIKK